MAISTANPRATALSEDKLAAVERYVIRGGRSAYDRLKVLAAASLRETSDLFDRVGIAPGMRCLDLGCGSGDVTFELARRTGPAGHVTGVDQDEVKVALAREEAAEEGMAHVEFHLGNVYEWDEPEAYDAVYCRFLLQHLNRPVDLLRSMWAGVRPGGVIIAEDADFTGSFSEPPNAGHDFFLRAYPEVLERQGGDPLAARKLFRPPMECRGDGRHAVPLVRRGCRYTPDAEATSASGRQ